MIRMLIASTSERAFSFRKIFRGRDLHVAGRRPILVAKSRQFDVMLRRVADPCDIRVTRLVIPRSAGNPSGTRLSTYRVCIKLTPANGMQGSAFPWTSAASHSGS